MFKRLIIISYLILTASYYAQNGNSSGYDVVQKRSIQNLSASDGTLRIEGTGSVKVFPGAELKVKDAIDTTLNEDQLIVESDGNLIQINNGAINKGNITVKRDIKISSGRQQFNYLGTPVAFKDGQTFRTIYDGINYVLYHNQATNYFLNSSGVNIPGRGIAVQEPSLQKVPAAAKIIAQFKGVPQNGEIIIPVANRDTAVDTYGYNLVGNPYPSNIDLRKLYDINGGKTDLPQSQSPNIEPTFYFWDNNNNARFQQEGSGYNGEAYALFNVLTGPEGTGLGTKSKIGTKVPTKIVKVGQGFMIRSRLNTYNFKFNNSIRTGENEEADFLGKHSQKYTVDRFWLQMMTPTGIVSSLAVVYYPGGSNSLGVEDSKSMGGSDAIYTKVENENIAINGRSVFTVEDVLPLGSQHFAPGNFTIALQEKEGIFAEGQAVYLKDRLTGIITNLTAGNYTFTANKGESTGRFEIIYRPETVLATDTPMKEDLQVYRNGNRFIVKTPSDKITGVEVYDVSGKLIHKLSPNSNEVFIDADILSGGLYILKIYRNGAVTSRKILY